MTFATFDDPDGNTWLLQEVTNRLPGRVAAETSDTSANDLIQTLIRAAKAHGEHEKRIGQTDPEWPVWYAEYMVREQAGLERPQWPDWSTRARWLTFQKRSEPELCGWPVAHREGKVHRVTNETIAHHHVTAQDAVAHSSETFQSTL
jgi:hypothetical protein